MQKSKIKVPQENQHLKKTQCTYCLKFLRFIIASSVFMVFLRGRGFLLHLASSWALWKGLPHSTYARIPSFKFPTFGWPDSLLTSLLWLRQQLSRASWHNIFLEHKIHSFWPRSEMELHIQTLDKNDVDIEIKVSITWVLHLCMWKHFENYGISMEWSFTSSSSSPTASQLSVWTRKSHETVSN